MTEHIWLSENLDAYLAGGLDYDERARLDAHLAECPDCARVLTQAQRMETYMTDLFPDARPDAALEDRAIARLRKSKPRPSWLRFVYAAAAVFVLGIIGAAVQAVAMSGGLPLPGMGRLQMAAQGVADSRGRHFEGRSYFGALTIAPARDDAESKFTAVGSAIGHAEKKTEKVAAMDPHDTEALFAKEIRSITEGRINDLPNTYIGEVLIAGGEIKGNHGKHAKQAGKDLGGLVSGLTPEGSISNGKSQSGVWSEDTFLNSPDKSISGKRLATTFYDRDGAISNRRGFGFTPDGKALAKHELGTGTMASNGRPPSSKAMYDIALAAAPRVPETYFKPGDTPKHDPAKTPPDKAFTFGLGIDRSGPPATPLGNESPDGASKPRDKVLLGGLPAGGGKPAQAKDKDSRTGLSLPVQPEQQPPADPGLKIIRTGEMEFQVGSFDEAVASVVKLINGVKGGFKLKEDSTKQPNGKTRGHVVVRMPPQFLDKFVLDLRRELGKLGADLRTQRIGSQDVTKQFTDTESELKAARAVEGRLIEIIKTGKGEVKDLVAAERELGTWRTKIEKMEGEIRYYSNQVALSTLTINLVEKEIEAASALVVSAKVQMRIEVDDVTKARETTEKAVADLKGRLLKSDEKQHPAGQVEAVLQAEIPPANRNAFTAVLTKLGIVSAHEEAQTQTAEGGAGQPINVTPRVKDVFFDVKLNNVVNIEPKHSIALDIVAKDVPVVYNKLRDAILQTSKGQLRKAKLDEADAQKAVGSLVFNVPTDKKPALDKVLAEIGPVLKRENIQADVASVSTDQKFGYVVNLYSVGVIAPREEVAIKVDAPDVKKKAAEVIEAVRAVKGEASQPTFSLNPAGQMTALIKMRVPLSANDSLVRSFMEGRRVQEWKQAPNPSVPENDLSTAQITLLLTGGSPLVPDDESIWSRMRAGLYIGFTVFAWCITVVIIGLCGILPWAIVLWLGFKAYMWMTKSNVPPPQP